MSTWTRSARAWACCALFCASPTAFAEGLELLDAGQEPRRSLLLEVQAGATEKVRMTTTVTTQVGMPGMPIPSISLPATVLDMDLTVDAVSQDGNVSFTAVIVRAEPLAGEGVTPEVVEQVGATLASLVGTRVQSTMTPDRRVTDSKVVPAPGADPMFSAQMGESVQATSAQVPSVPVGLGASWTVHDSGEQQGISVDVHSTYTISALSENSYVFDVAVTQTAAESELDIAGLPAGTQATLEMMESSGTGQTVMHRDRVMPMSGQLSLSMSMEATITAGGMPLPMTMQTSMQNQIAPR